MMRTLLYLLFMGCMAWSHAQEAAWMRSFGGSGDDYGRAVAVVDGGYLIAGSTNSFYAPTTDVYLIHIDTSGEYQWGRNFGEAGFISWAVALAVDHEGNIIMAGYTNNSQGNGYDGLLVKTDQQGNLIWKKHYGGPDWDFFHTVTVDDSGHVYAGGERITDGHQGAWMVKTDASGNVLWERFAGCSGEAVISGLDFCEAGQLVFSGTCKGAQNEGPYTLAGAFNEQGEVLWERSIDELGKLINAGCRCGHNNRLLLTGNFEIEEDTENWGANNWTALERTTGNLIWQQPRITPEPKRWLAIHSKPDGRILMAGERFGLGFGEWDGNTIVLSAGGWDIDGTFAPIFGGFEDDRLYDVAPATDGGYIAVGETNSFGNGHQVMVVKVGPNGEVSQSNIDFLDIATTVTERVSSGALHCWPNPAGQALNVSWPAHFAGKALYGLYDISGRLVMHGEIHQDQPLLLDVLAEGPYVLLVTHSGFQAHQKVIIKP